MTNLALFAVAAALSTSHPAHGAAKPHTAPPQAPAPYKVPRNAFGQPDMDGFWTNATLTPETRPPALGDRAAYTPQEVVELESAVVKEVEEGNADIDPNTPAPKVGGEVKPGTRPAFAAAGGAVGGYDRGWLEPGNTVMRVNGVPRTSFLTTANGQAPLPKSGGAAAPGFGGHGGDARRYSQNYEHRSLGERCILSFGRNAGPPMFPNAFYNNNYQFLQTKDAFVIDVEMNHDLRIVRLGGAHRTDGVRPWMGDSIGRWEGDTLVVETTNIPRQQAYRGAWQHLTVTERFTRVGKDRVHYAFTINDPTLWDAPWGGDYEFAPLKGQIYEYACHEGNYALPGILAGARADEAEAAAAKAAPATTPAKGKAVGQ